MTIVTLILILLRLLNIERYSVKAMSCSVSVTQVDKIDVYVWNYTGNVTSHNQRKITEAGQWINTILIVSDVNQSKVDVWKAVIQVHNLSHLHSCVNIQSLTPVTCAIRSFPSGVRGFPERCKRKWNLKNSDACHTRWLVNYVCHIAAVLVTGWQGW